MKFGGVFAFWSGFAMSLIAVPIGQTIGQEVEVNIEKLDDSALFLEEAELYVPEDVYDVITDIDIGSEVERAKAVHEIAKGLLTNDTSLEPELKASLLRQCQADRDRAARLQGLAKGEMNDKDERFVIATVVAGIASGMAGLLWGRTQDHDTIRQVAKEQGKVIKVVKGLDHHLQSLEEHQQALLATLKEQEQASLVRERKYQVVMWLQALLAEQDRHLARLERVITHVISRGTWPPGLWTEETFRSTVSDLAAEAEAAGGRLVAEAEHTLARLPVSFGMFSSLRFRVATHFPLVNEGATFRVMRLASRQWPIDRYNGSGVLRQEELYARLVTRADGRYSALSRTERDGWLRLTASSYISPSAIKTWSPTGPPPSCLAQLWVGRRAPETSACHIVAGRRVQLESAGGHRWIACGQGPSPPQMRIACGREPQIRRELQGCYLLTLKQGCTLEAGEMQVRAVQHHPHPPRLVRAPQVGLKREMMSRISTHPQLESWPPEGATLHSSEDLSEVVVGTDPWDWLSLLLSGLTGCLALAATAWCLKQGRGRWCRRQETSCQDSMRTTGWSESMRRRPGSKGSRGRERSGSCPAPETWELAAIPREDQVQLWDELRGRHLPSTTPSGRPSTSQQLQWALVQGLLQRQGDARSRFPSPRQQESSLQTQSLSRNLHPSRRPTLGSVHPGWRDADHPSSRSSSPRPKKRSESSSDKPRRENESSGGSRLRSRRTSSAEREDRPALQTTQQQQKVERTATPELELELEGPETVSRTRSGSRSWIEEEETGPGERQGSAGNLNVSIG